MPVQISGVKDSYTAKIGRTASILSNPFGACEQAEPQIQRPGDVWVEGLRTSLSAGIYELWVDDILGGPMESRNRLRVNEAAARYYKDIDPTEQRYATHRVNPLASVLPSNAITPVQVYIYDWFGDPNLYIGVMAVVAALLTGIDEDPINEYNKRYIDQGEFDYNQLYSKVEGVEIK